MKVNIRLNLILSSKNMSQRELARLTNIRPQTINDMAKNESKRISLDNLAKICQVLNCDLSDILELIPDRE